MPAYKDSKNNSWYAKFNYKNWKGETKFKTKRGFQTKRAAVEYEREFKLHIAGDLDEFRGICEIVSGRLVSKNPGEHRGNKGSYYRYKTDPIF